jgi:hypothetical protein
MTGSTFGEVNQELIQELAPAYAGAVWLMNSDPLSE